MCSLRKSVFDCLEHMMIVLLSLRHGRWRMNLDNSQYVEFQTDQEREYTEWFADQNQELQDALLAADSSKHAAGEYKNEAAYQQRTLDRNEAEIRALLKR